MKLIIHETHPKNPKKNEIKEERYSIQEDEFIQLLNAYRSTLEEEITDDMKSRFISGNKNIFPSRMFTIINSSKDELTFQPTLKERISVRLIVQKLDNYKEVHRSRLYNFERIKNLISYFYKNELSAIKNEISKANQGVDEDFKKLERKGKFLLFTAYLLFAIFLISPFVFMYKIGLNERSIALMAIVYVSAGYIYYDSKKPFSKK